MNSRCRTVLYCGTAFLLLLGAAALLKPGAVWITDKVSHDYGSSWGFYEGTSSVSPERQPHKDGLLESKVAQLPSRCCMFPETNPVTNLVFKK